MNEFNLNSASPSEQDQSATTKSEQANPLHNEVLQQWQLNSLLKKADADKSGSLSEREIKDAANNAIKAKPGSIEPANLTSEEQKIAQLIQSNFKYVKQLDHEQSHLFKEHDKVLFADRDVSKKDLDKLVNDPRTKLLIDDFKKIIADLPNREEFARANRLDQDQLHFTKEILEAMAKGDEIQLAGTLDRYGWRDEETLKRYMEPIKKILAEKGSRINFTKESSNISFTDVVFPMINGETTNGVKSVNDYVPGKIIYPSRKEPKIYYDDNGNEQRWRG